MRPGWTPIFAKAICIVARDEPSLRTFYLKWPWPHFYEVPRSVVMAVVIRDSFDSDVPVMLKIGVADEQSLIELDETSETGQERTARRRAVDRAAIAHQPLPILLRRLFWAFALNIGRQRANHFGTASITSLANLGSKRWSRKRPARC